MVNSNKFIDSREKLIYSNLIFFPLILCGHQDLFLNVSLVLINSIDYMSYSGNLTIQISDHLMQLVILEGFFKEVLPNKI